MRIARHRSSRASRSAAESPEGSNVWNSPGRRTKVFSWRKKTVSSPTVRARSPRPMVTFRMGGAEAAPSAALASGEASGHFSSDSFPAANFMANVRHVGYPHFLQLVLGRSLKICKPVNGMLRLRKLRRTKNRVVFGSSPTPRDGATPAPPRRLQSEPWRWPCLLYTSDAADEED